MNKIFLTVLTLFSLHTYSASIRIVNRTGVQIRVAELYNSCRDVIVHRDTPVYLEDGESYLASDIRIVMHHYKICGNGKCILTAMGIKEDLDYELGVELDGDLVEGVPSPDHWVGNMECGQP